MRRSFKKIQKVAIKLSQVICLFSILVNNSFAQQLNQADNINTMVDAAAMNALITNLQEENTKQAELKASFPAVDTFSDGKIGQLDHVDANGQAVYLTSYSNLGCAQTVGAADLWSGNNTRLPLNGTGQIVGVWDGGAPLATHREFENRVIVKDYNRTTNKHATHVTGTILAKGITGFAHGMANESTVWAYNWSSAFVEMAQAASQGLQVSNHSYGALVNSNNLYQFGKYGFSAHYFDEVAKNAPYYTIVKAAGNYRNDGLNTADGGYDLIPDGGNSKNTITVGAVDLPTNRNAGSARMSVYSGWGPTDDWRIKPDLVAPGGPVTSCSNAHDSAYYTEYGTSMASPVVTGSIALLNQFAKSKYNMMMRSATVKALLINTAVDRGNVGPDFQYGWGVLDIESAVRVLESKGRFSEIQENNLLQNQVDTITVKSDGHRALRTSLVWTDFAAPTPTALTEDDYIKALINDLDMRIYKDGQEFKPYTFDSSLGFSQVASHGDNSRDNLECIFIDSTTAGEYKIVISHKNTLVGGSQNYSLVIDGTENQAITTPVVISIDSTSSDKIIITRRKNSTAGICKIEVKSSVAAHNQVITQSLTDTVTVISGLQATEKINVTFTNYKKVGNTVKDSSYSITVYATTSASTAVAITNLAVSNINPESVEVKWNTNTKSSVKYNLSYRVKSSKNWIDTSFTSAKNSIILSDLKDSTSYELKIKADNAKTYQTINFTTTSVGNNSNPLSITTVSEENGYKFAQNGMNLTIQNIEWNQINVEILTLNGAAVSTSKIEKRGTANISLENMAPGMYIIHLSGANETIGNHKVIK